MLGNLTGWCFKMRKIISGWVIYMRHFVLLIYYIYYKWLTTFVYTNFHFATCCDIICIKVLKKLIINVLSLFHTDKKRIIWFLVRFTTFLIDWWVLRQFNHFGWVIFCRKHDGWYWLFYDRTCGQWFLYISHKYLINQLILWCTG